MKRQSEGASSSIPTRNDAELTGNNSSESCLFAEGTATYSIPYSVRLSEIIQQVPREIWKIILSFEFPTPSRSDFDKWELNLKQYSSVCTLWQNLTHENVLECYNVQVEEGPEVSDWIISHFGTSVLTLDLDRSNDDDYGPYSNRFWRIGDKGVKRLENLTELSLAANHSVTNEVHFKF
jgi:hypothetical protein